MSDQPAEQQRDPRIVRTVVHTLCIIALALIVGQICAALIEQQSSATGSMSDQTAATLKDITNYVLGVVSGLLISTRVGK